MQDVYGKITYRGKEYKLVFNLNVMEKIQEKYGTLDAWGALTDGSKSNEPDARAVIYGFTQMLNEGIDIDNEENGANTPFFTEKQVGRLITETGFAAAVGNLNETVVKSTESAEKNA